jgi:hypothetical protein
MRQTWEGQNPRSATDRGTGPTGSDVRHEGPMRRGAATIHEVTRPNVARLTNGSNTVELLPPSNLSTEI